MSRTLAALLLSAALLLRAQDSKRPATPDTQQQVQEPPEEDQSFKPRTYEFNPLKASQSITAGTFYFDKKNYVAAKNRFVDATLYDPGNSEGFEKLGEAEEKMHDYKGALAAYKKLIELEPTSKEIPAIKKRAEKWPASAKPPADFFPADTKPAAKK